MLNLILEYRAEAQLGLALAIGLAALRWGGGPERALALVWLIGIEGIDGFYHWVSGAGITLDEVDRFHALLDVGLTLALVAVALQANRNYPLWIAAFQLVATTAHFAREIAAAITPIGYAVMVVAPSWFQLALMLAGLMRHIRRRRRFGAYRDWRKTAGPPPPPLYV